MFTLIFSEWTWINIVFRMVLSLAVGMVIGIDRGAKRRGGGARTTITVCLGSTMVMLLEQYLEALYPDGSTFPGSPHRSSAVWDSWAPAPSL